MRTGRDPAALRRTGGRRDDARAGHERPACRPLSCVRTDGAFDAPYTRLAPEAWNAFRTCSSVAACPSAERVIATTSKRTGGWGGGRELR